MAPIPDYVLRVIRHTGLNVKTAVHHSRNMAHWPLVQRQKGLGFRKTKFITAITSLGLLMSTSSLLISCSIPSNLQTNSERPHESFAVETTTQNQIQVVFTQEPPAWAEDIDSIVLALEQWRNKSFLEDLQVTFLPQTEAGLNGWYNSETKELVVNLLESEALGRGTLLHEVHHALQDQHFDLYNLHSQSQDQFDYDRAVTAIIEGEAMLAVSELMNYDFLAHAQLPTDQPISEDFFEKVFLYGAGLQFIQAIRDEGGWAAVDAMFQDPPRSTTLIFHPERYLKGDREVEAISMPLADDETITAQIVNGEYALRQMLATPIETRPALNILGNNYVTDTLGNIQTANGQELNRWVIQLQTAAVAENLMNAIQTAVQTAYPEQSIRIERDENILITEW